LSNSRNSQNGTYYCGTYELEDLTDIVIEDAEYVINIILTYQKGWIIGEPCSLLKGKSSEGESAKEGSKYLVLF